MKVTIATDQGKIFNFDVDPNEPVEHLKALIEVEVGIPVVEQILLHDGRELTNSQKLTECGVKENDVLVALHQSRRQLQRTSTPLQTQTQQSQLPSTRDNTEAQTPARQSTNRTTFRIPTNLLPPSLLPQNSSLRGDQTLPIDPETFQAAVRADPPLLQQIIHNDPALAEAILADDITLLRELLIERARIKQEEERRRLQRIQQLNSDPFNPELQKQIEEEIREQQIQENIEQALEYNPESFGRVVMLYIDVEVNKVPVKAFVDSGAQQTIMSQRCAERCGIMRLLDRKFAGIAKGVGTARIIGRIHLAPIKIGNSFFPCSFTVLEDSSLDFLLGLDMLRRHQCIIDLKENVLRIGNEKVPFLAEKDIPLAYRLQELPSDEIIEDKSNNNNKSSSSIESSKTTPTTSSSSSTTTPSTPPSSTTTSSTPPSTSSSFVPSRLTQPPRSSPKRRTDSPVSSYPPLLPQIHVQNFPETSIRQLTDLGYSRDEAIHALQICNGNVELAASFLFEKSSRF